MTAPSIWAVLPVKPFAVAKRRLTPVLSSHERAQLAQLLFEDVLALLAACTVLSGIVVVTRDEVAARIARTKGAQVLPDRDLDLNAAVRAAADLLGGCRSAGMVVVPSDIPLLPAPLIDELSDRIAR